MIFSLILFVLFGAVAFFHYIQGFFTATISAILVVFATIVALAYHEQAARFLVNSGKMPEQAASVALVVLFALVYIIPRVLFDKLVPGNVRFYSIVDKIGAGVMGVLVGLLVTGVVAVAASALPFGPSVAGYSRLGVTDDVATILQTKTKNADTEMHDVVNANTMDPNDENHLWFHQDDLAVGLINKVSSPTGSLQGDEPFSAIHPDYPGELFLQRLGIQIGSRRTLVNTDSNQPFKVSGVYTQPSFTEIDGELVLSNRSADAANLDPVLKPGDNQTLLVVRSDISGAKDAGDDADSILRFSPGDVRLVAGHKSAASVDYKNYYPVALLDPHRIAVLQKLDDFLFSDMRKPKDRTIDFIFVVDNDHLDGDPTKPPFKLPDGSFIEFKRYGQVDLSNASVDYGPPPNDDVDYVIRKPDEADKIAAAHPIPAVMPQSVDSSVPLDLKFVGADSSAKMFSGVDVNNGNASAPVSLAMGVTGDFAQRKWVHLTILDQSAISDLTSPGDELIDTVTVAPGDSLVQVHLMAPTSGDQMWAWGQHLSDFQVTDATGKVYSCVGAWAKVLQPDPYMVANFAMYGPDNRLLPMVGKGRPTDIYLAFEVPTGAVLGNLQYSGASVADLSKVKVK